MNCNSCILNLRSSWQPWWPLFSKVHFQSFQSFKPLFSRGFQSFKTPVFQSFQSFEKFIFEVLKVNFNIIEYHNAIFIKTSFIHENSSLPQVWNNPLWGCECSYPTSGDGALTREAKKRGCWKTGPLGAGYLLGCLLLHRLTRPRLPMGIPAHSILENRL